MRQSNLRGASTATGFLDEENFIPLSLLCRPMGIVQLLSRRGTSSGSVSELDDVERGESPMESLKSGTCRTESIDTNDGFDDATDAGDAGRRSCASDIAGVLT